MTALTQHRSFLSDVLTRQYDRRKLIDPGHIFEPQPTVTGFSSINDRTPELEQGGQPVAGPSKPTKRHIVNYVPEEETVRNDLSGWYVQSREFGSNHIHGAADHEICEEYPALRRLMDLKAEHVTNHAHPPLHLPLVSPSPSEITSSLGPTRFDVILLRPLATWQQTAELPIRSISADPGFVFLWVGKGDEEGLERGRECFAKWGFRRAEDIVWVKTNHAERDTNRMAGGNGTGANGDTGIGGSGGGGLFASSKEHCLMGIRGTVRRSTDSRFVHCNVDTDVIVHGPNSPADNETNSFPPYLYTLIENFCLGARRLELFGDVSTARRGWVTASLPLSTTTRTTTTTTTTTTSPAVDTEIPESPLQFDPATYPTMIPPDPKPVVPFHPEIDHLRPKSPARRGPQGSSRGGSSGQVQGQRYANSNNPNRPQSRPPRYDPHQQSFQPQSYPQQYQHSMPQPQTYQHNHQAIDPMAMAMQAQMQVQMQMQMQQAQMMAAMNMMDPMMLAQAQAQAQAMQMQGQGYQQLPHSQEEVYGTNPYQQQMFQGQEMGYGYLQHGHGNFAHQQQLQQQQQQQQQQRGQWRGPGSGGGNGAGGYQAGPPWG